MGMGRGGMPNHPSTLLKPERPVNPSTPWIAPPSHLSRLLIKSPSLVITPKSQSKPDIHNSSFTCSLLTFKVIYPLAIQYPPPDFRSILTPQKFYYRFMFRRSLLSISSLVIFIDSIVTYAFPTLLAPSLHGLRDDWDDVLSLYYWSRICWT
jgi:hypothetical protein